MSEDSIDKKGASVQGQHMGKIPNIIAAGKITAFDGDADVAIIGLKATDIVTATIDVDDGGGTKIGNLIAKPAADTLNISCVGTPTTGDGVVSYQVLRPGV